MARRPCSAENQDLGGLSSSSIEWAQEVDNAHQTIAQWYKNEMDIYSFGSGLGRRWQTADD